MEIPCLGLHALPLMEYLQEDKTIIDKNLVILSSAFIYIYIYIYIYIFAWATWLILDHTL